jgi:hypothetical protein
MMGAGGLAEQACWDCGLTGHRRGDDVCKEKGACGGNSCPPFLKRLKAERKDVMPRAGGGDSRKGGGHKAQGRVQLLRPYQVVQVRWQVQV